MRYASRGFTLIELLVVVAIIGVLSSVVLVSLNSARNKGNDAAIQSNFSTIQTQAELYYATTGNNTYGGAASSGSCNVANSLFVVDSTIDKAIDSAESANGSGTGVVCNSSSTAYAVSSVLLGGINGNMYWCVDSSGSAKAVATQLSAGTTECPS